MALEITYLPHMWPFCLTEAMVLTVSRAAFAGAEGRGVRPALLRPEGHNLRLPTPLHKCFVTAALPRDSFQASKKALLPFVYGGAGPFSYAVTVGLEPTVAPKRMTARPAREEDDDCTGPTIEVLSVYPLTFTLTGLTSTDNRRFLACK